LVAKLVLFRGAVDSACGLANAAAGPFYCAPDDRVYLDRSFFEDLSKRFGAPGEFAADPTQDALTYDEERTSALRRASPLPDDADSRGVAGF
jgi:hypothetical protein